MQIVPDFHIDFYKVNLQGSSWEIKILYLCHDEKL